MILFVVRFPFGVESHDNHLQPLTKRPDLDAPDEGLFAIEFFVLGVIFLNRLDFVPHEGFVRYGRRWPSIRTSQVANVSTRATKGLNWTISKYK